VGAWLRAGDAWVAWSSARFRWVDQATGSLVRVWGVQMTFPDASESGCGETAGFDAFFVSEYPRLVALGLALTRDRELADDVAQEALLRAYRDWSRVEQLERPGAWVRRAALNLIADRGRRASTARYAHQRMGAGESAAQDSPFDAEFWSTVAALPDRQRTAVALFYVLDRSVDEVAATMGVRRGTVSRMLHEARATLRRRLEERSVDGEVSDAG
jgi:RNA polymerase sigma-70 factor, ECF subfamily